MSEWRVPLAGEILKGLFLAGVLPGAAVLLLYLCELQFHPSGSSLGDGLIFIAISMVFGFLYSLYFALVFSGAIFLLAGANWINPRLAKISSRLGTTPTHFPSITWEKPFAYIGGVAIVMIGVLWSFGHAGSRSALLIMVFMAAVYVGIQKIPWRRSIHTRNSDDSTRVRKMDLAAKTARVILVAILILIPLWSPEGLWSPRSSLTHLTMQYLGIRNEGATVVFINADVRRAVGLTGGGRRLKCVDILLTGVGERSLIELQRDGTVHHISLPTEDLLIIRTVAEQGNAVDATKPRD